MGRFWKLAHHNIKNLIAQKSRKISNHCFIVKAQTISAILQSLASVCAFGWLFSHHICSSGTQELKPPRASSIWHFNSALIEFPNCSLDSPAVLGNTGGGRRDTLKWRTDIKSMQAQGKGWEKQLSQCLNCKVPGIIFSGGKPIQALCGLRGRLLNSRRIKAKARKKRLLQGYLLGGTWSPSHSESSHGQSWNSEMKGEV